MSARETIGALVLAAGKGTRMHSDKPKVLQELLGAPMLRYVYTALDPLFGEGIWTVVGHRSEMIEEKFAGEERNFIHQTEQLGTGHALQTAWDELVESGLSHVLVVNGDTPLLPQPRLINFLKESLSNNADIGFMTLTLPHPGSFGRVVRHLGDVAAIIEAKDYDENLHGPEPREINAGIYLLNIASVTPLLKRLCNENKSGEYYITDLVGFAVQEQMTVAGVECGNDPQLLGINNPAELVRSESLLRATLVMEWLEQGVTIHAPEYVRLGPMVTLEPGAVLHGPCELYGTTHVKRGAEIYSNTWIKDSTLAEGCVIHPFSHLDGATVGNDCTVGPYARLRPGAVMEQSAKVGNFVEMKKTVLGEGSKANHFTYLGDTEVGTGVNIGAGTITCNYDGVNKYKTIIEDNAFIGSNSSLVAPVCVGKNSLVGAGSVITKDIPENTIAVARGKQKNLPKKC
ncbi:bifunctional UDP-N-acetylglucosamine diphosphorylase/glucosamine-1-phosphate N-acetyltransferase GlmU [Halodesulfovibrio sp. MK-HDV]|jgi:bifunctional UDP-N-acetylglucosamine pyrophosphorylase / glucosamine-1-phosphate N-acetyltransferase|uniref:bifunctional UDP-N-acetylglucosamine diphosphorylase/glucosamine-1-phosphate N-acetyltransferase GlmU n=1 Tax=unclassified Halodesulfovibrio TaxID=2644657 RepID=UPI00136FFF0A|nr:bifunctional UDP-N-acetylglucosamine diphosphorylase/glucosamine-1-phosphate N-acetyltransferase GlmU [Halodesulfovibrio sp. MK-HDV]KAF1076814.1 Bifunctional protein GlmU [Halodesulfovibrio sp. MK-HDV]